MITQRFTGDEGTMAGRLVIENVPGDMTGYAELQGLADELALRISVKTEGAVITKVKVDEMPPPPPAEEG